VGRKHKREPQEEGISVKSEIWREHSVSRLRISHIYTFLLKLIAEILFWSYFLS
jgi:hypothetical protein